MRSRAKREQCMLVLRNKLTFCTAPYRRIGLRDGLLPNAPALITLLWFQTDEGVNKVIDSMVRSIKEVNKCEKKKLIFLTPVEKQRLATMSPSAAQEITPLPRNRPNSKSKKRLLARAMHVEKRFHLAAVHAHVPNSMTQRRLNCKNVCRRSPLPRPLPLLCSISPKQSASILRHVMQMFEKHCASAKSRSPSAKCSNPALLGVEKAIDPSAKSRCLATIPHQPNRQVPLQPRWHPLHSAQVPSPHNS